MLWERLLKHFYTALQITKSYHVECPGYAHSVV